MATASRSSPNRPAYTSKVIDADACPSIRCIREPVSTLLDKCSYSPAGWCDLRKRGSGNEYECCGYIRALEEITALCLQLTTWFREARVEILNGNKAAPVLNEDPFIWLLNFAPPVNYEEAVKWRMEEIERDRNFRLRITRERNELRTKGGSMSLKQYASADTSEGREQPGST
ncbi:hypothetical protein GCM10011576_07010 [Micromonospora parathelypteridis]|nr:hypothetical protein GCM10011576_07010 [Micromonospora parathelypteridis]